MSHGYLCLIMHWGVYFIEVLIAAALCKLTEDAGKCTVFLFSVSHSFFFCSLSLVLYCIYCMHEYDALLYGGNKESIYLSTQELKPLDISYDQIFLQRSTQTLKYVDEFPE